MTDSPPRDPPLEVRATTPPIAPTSDWAVDATDRVVELVDVVRDKTTGPVLKVGRGAVYGTAIAIVAIPVFVLLVIVIVRGMNTLLHHAFDVGIWVTYLIIGLAFVGSGMLCWSRRSARP